MANWANTRRLGDPSSAAWQQQNLVPVTVGGQTWQVFKPAAPAFEGFLNELAARGYQPRSSGGFNYRNIRGGNTLSQHAFGNAIDINAAANAMGQRGTDLPAGTQALADKYGLEWGANWRRPDPMHFEWKGSPGVGADYAGSPAPLDPGAGAQPMPWDMFGNAGALPRMGTPEPPPMTPERFLMGMIAGENPLRRMVLGKLGSLFS